MKKRLIIIVMVTAMIFCMMPALSFASDLPGIDDKTVLYTPSKDYRGGDCILTSTKTMLRRLAIMNGSGKWYTITNAAIRPYATTRGLLKFSFNYKNDGISYTVCHGYFKGKSAAAKRKEIAKLLKLHPEGIVVWGSNSTKYFGPHGVLAVGVEGKSVYAVDSAFNRGIFKKGIQHWRWTIMGNLKRCTKYWYVKSNSGSASPIGKGESVLCIEDVRAPLSIEEGKGFTIKGDIFSNYKISSVEVAVIDDKGKAAISKTVRPDSWSYSILSMDKDIKFGSLVPGNYTYRVKATDKKKTLTLVEKSFTVIGDNSNSVSSLGITDVRAPEKLIEGNAFTIKGIVKSNCTIKSVKVSVVDSAGKTVLKASAKPGKKSFSILTIDNDFKMGTLKKGTYTYKVTATDEKQKKTLFSTIFRVE